MRILVYKNNLTTGRGADRAVCTLCGLLAAAHETVLATDAAGALSCPVDSRVQLKRIPLSVDALRTAIEEARPDVILSTGTDEINDLAAAFPAKFPAPVVQQFHIYPPGAFKPRRWVRNARTKRALRRCAAIQVLLPGYVDLARRLLRYKGVVRAIGNAAPGIDPLPPSADPVILYPAAFHKDKRQDLLIRAFARLKRRVPSAELVLAGTGKPQEQARLRRLADKLGIAKSVSFPGYLADLRPLFARAAVVAFPSRREGFPLTLLESAAAGRLAVGCADCPASRDLIPQFEGILASKPDPKAYAAALYVGLEKASTFKVPRTALDAYAPAAIAGQWESLLKEVAE